jgi:hypothetical protein
VEDEMGVAALVAWVLTGIGGATMMVRWVGAGGARSVVPAPAVPVPVPGGAVGGPPGGSPPAGTRLTPRLVFGHAGLASTGLLVWLAYLVSGARPLAWVALVLLLAVSGLGEIMFLRWFGARAGAEPVIESGFPRPLVYGHGLGATVTILLVLLTALGVAS